MEQPNLEYIKEIANGNVDFENKLIQVIKKEFPEERAVFEKNHSAKDFKSTAQCVHKLKHKINILGLAQAHNTAVQFEEELRRGEDTSFIKFMSILDMMESYIKTL